jgi:hypothetical protein
MELADRRRGHDLPDVRMRYPERFWLVSLITPLMIAVVIGLIAGLDSPRNGFIRTDVRSLQRVEHDLDGQRVAPAEKRCGDLRARIALNSRL